MRTFGWLLVAAGVLGAQPRVGGRMAARKMRTAIALVRLTAIRVLGRLAAPTCVTTAAVRTSIAQAQASATGSTTTAVTKSNTRARTVAEE